MTISLTRSTATALVGAACIFGAVGCGGSDAPKVSSSGFLSTCKDKGASNKQLSSALSAYQIAQLCTCIQKELVAKGDGDKKYNDSSLKGVSNEAGATCLAKITKS